VAWGKIVGLRGGLLNDVEKLNLMGKDCMNKFDFNKRILKFFSRVYILMTSNEHHKWLKKNVIGPAVRKCQESPRSRLRFAQEKVQGER